MRQLATCLAVVALAAPGVRAGTVTFDPSAVEISAGEGADLSFDVWVASPWGLLESIDMIIGSDTVPMDPEDWTYAPGMEPSGWAYFASPSPQSVYPFGIGGLGGFAFMGSVSSPILLGTLAIDASGLPVGDHSIMVDGERDDGRSNVAFGLDTDPLFGSATITVIPEPITIVLLGVMAPALPWIAGKRGEARK